MGTRAEASSWFSASFACGATCGRASTLYNTRTAEAGAEAGAAIQKKAPFQVHTCVQSAQTDSFIAVAPVNSGLTRTLALIRQRNDF